MGKIFKILAIDGGGARGVIPARFLMELERRTGKQIYELFDLITGTSTGSIIALGLTMPGPDGQPRYKAEDALYIYRREGPRIFSTNLQRLLLTLNGYIRPKYAFEPLESILKQYFGDARLKDTLRDVIVSTYDIEKRMPWFFRTLKAREQADYDFSLVEVIRAATAAPSYFSPARITTTKEEMYTLVDGGVFANNPAMVGYVDALSKYKDYERVMVVSLGTGLADRSFPYNKARQWGLIGWALPAVDILQRGVSESVDYQMDQVLNRNPESTALYYRLQVNLGKNDDVLDNPTPEFLDRLEDEAKRYIVANGHVFDEMCGQLLEIAPMPEHKKMPAPEAGGEFDARKTPDSVRH